MVGAIDDTTKARVDRTKEEVGEDFQGIKDIYSRGSFLGCDAPRADATEPLG